MEEAAAHQMAAAGEITKAAKSSPIWTATTRHGPTEDPFSLLSVAYLSIYLSVLSIVCIALTRGVKYRSTDVALSG